MSALHLDRLLLVHLFCPSCSTSNINVLGGDLTRSHARCRNAARTLRVHNKSHPIWSARTQFSLLILLILVPNDVGAQSSVKFTNITEQTGVHFRHEDGRSYKKYFVETLGSGVALFDYNNDDHLDLYFVNGADLDS